MKYYALNSIKLAIASVLILAFIYSIPGLIYVTVNTGVSIGAWLQQHNF